MLPCGSCPAFDSRARRNGGERDPAAPIENPVFIGLGFHVVSGVEIKGACSACRTRMSSGSKLLSPFRIDSDPYQSGKEVADLVESVNPVSVLPEAITLTCSRVRTWICPPESPEWRGVLLPLPAVYWCRRMPAHSDVSSLHPSFPEKEKGSLCGFLFFQCLQQTLNVSSIDTEPRTSHAVLFPFPHTASWSEEQPFQGQSDIRTETS